jgi:hypothetical protein
MHKRQKKKNERRITELGEDEGLGTLDLPTIPSADITSYMLVLGYGERVIWQRNEEV